MADLTSLRFVGNGLIVVQSRIEGRPQQAFISGAASIGTLAGEIGSTFSVQGIGDNPWTITVQHQDETGAFVTSPVRLGAVIQIGGVPAQIIESERDVPTTAASDFRDLVLRVERATAVPGQGGGGPGPGPTPLSFSGDARVVIHATSATGAQQILIQAAQSGGTLPVVVGNALNVVANGGNAWTLRLQQADSAGNFVDRALSLGAVTVQDNVRTQFVVATDNGDTIIRVEQPVAQPQPGDTFVVQGRVQWANGDVFSGSVRAFDKDLRHEQPLGTATTDATGAYQITYAASAFSTAELRAADLIVRAMGQDASGADKVLAESPVLFNARPVELIDLTIGALPATALSEYELLEEEITPLLDGAKVSELTDAKDVPFLAAELGEPADRVWFFALANRFAPQLGDVPAMALYGLLRQGVGVELSTLLENTPTRHKDALTRSGDLFIIAIARLGATVDDLVARLQAHRQSAGATKLQSLFTGTTGLSAADATALVALDIANPGGAGDFWSAVRQLPSFSDPGKVADAQFAVQAFALADGNLPLARLIQQRRPAGATDARALVSLTLADWQAMIRQSIQQGGALPAGLGGSDADAQIAAYAQGLALAVEGAFATTVVGNRVGTGPQIDVATAKLVLQRNPTLDPRRPLPPNVNLTDFTTPAARQHALDTMALVREEALAFPEVDMRAELLAAPTPVVAAPRVAAAAAPSAAAPAAVTFAPFTIGARAALASVFTQVPSFDLTDQRAVDFIAQHAGDILATLDAPTRAAVEGRLRAIQRLYNIVPRADVIFLLLNNGLSSATRIARIPQSTFVDEFQTPLGGAPVALSIHRAARRQAAAAATLFAMVNRVVNEANPFALGGTLDTSGLVEQLPSWATLFGQIELADCAECRAIHGPAAYLVDLLHFLETATVPDGTQSPIMVLDARRSDVLDLLLTCDNTHTEVSHSDLVIEVMEAFVAKSRLDAGQPAVDPEVLLDQAVFPLILPFDRALESERLHLGALGTTRFEILTLLRASNAANDGTAAAEGLGASPALAAILTESTPSHTLSEYFGFDADPAHGNIADLTRVRVFLQRTGLTFIELLELLGVRYLTEGATPLGVDPPPSSGSVDIDAMTLTGLTDAAQTRTHRFLRLLRALRVANPGLSLRQLDAALMAFAGTDAATRLLALGRAEQVRAALKLDVFPAYSLWGPMDTTTTQIVDENDVRVTVPSFYESAFFNPLVSTTPDADFALVRTATTAEVAGTAVALSTKTQALQGALRLTESDVLAIEADAGLGAANLSLANLSALYRYPLLARALRLTVKELIALRGLSQIDPFASPANTRALVDLVADLKATGFRVADLAFLLTHASDLDPTVAPAPGRIETLRTALTTQLAKVDAATDPSIPDPTGERLQGLLEDQLRDHPDGLRQMLDVLDGSSAFINADPAQRGPGVAFLTTTLPFLAPNGVADPGVSAILLAPAGADGEAAQRKARHDYLFMQLQTFLRATQRRDAVLQAVGSAVGLSPTLARTLIEDFLHSLAAFLAPATQAAFSTAFLRLQKAALLVARLKLRPDELSFFQGNSADWGGFDLNLLPTVMSPTPVFPFAAWRAVARFALLKRSVPALPDGATTTLLDVFRAAAAGATLDPVFGALVTVTQWTLDDVVAIATARGLGVADLRNATALLGVRDAVAVARRVGVAAAKLADWAANPADEAQAANVRDALKAQFDLDAWTTVAGPIDDRLRDRTREALIGYLLALPGVRDLGVATADQLFELFLIDVQMTSVMKTSRLVQATLAVQLFIQRCLMNLEPLVSPRAIDAARWAWMKNFRVWEANRKVFLYPENYLEPDLRDDKTPFFKQLETDLKQGDVTPDTVESAYLGYLRKLDDVAHIEIVGHCHDFDTGVQHVFGRTNDDPPVYYYRSFRDGSWTGWDRVPLEIESEHIAPVVYRRRLFLFWAIFKEKQVDPANSQLSQSASQDVSGDDKKPQRRWEVSLGWSELQEGKWSPKRISKGERGSARQPQSTGSLSLLESDNTWMGSTDPSAIAGTGNDLAQFFSNFLLPVHESPAPSQFSAEMELYRLNVSPYFGRELAVNLELAAASGSSGRSAHFLHLGFWNLVRTGLALSANPASNQRWVDLRPDGWSGGGMSWRLPGQLSLLAPVGFLSDAQRNIPGMEEAPILKKTPGGEVLFSPQDWMPVFAPPFPSLFFQDGQRAYYVERRDTTEQRWQNDQYLYPRALEVLKYPNDVPLSTLRRGLADPGFATSFPYYSGSGLMANLPRLAFGGYFREVQVSRVHFAPHYHPHVASLIELLNARGVPALFDPANQEVDDGGGVFGTYLPTSLVHVDLPHENFDFQIDGAYAPYNWELFFHTPMLIAEKLSREQRFAEAQSWYHYVFDPTTNDKPADDPALANLRFWRFRPFRQKSEPGRIQDLLQALADPSGDPAIKRSVSEQIRQWSLHPFQPHRVARLRLSAYQKMVFFKYLDNLIAWADQLFAQDTRESINQATQLYVLANDLLGPRPERIPEQDPPAPLSYRQLRDRIDAFGNALVDVEDLISTNPFGEADVPQVESLESDGATVVGFGETLYFCIPQNRKLLGYWDTIADRLFKIRNGLNLQGVARSLSLFAPEIDPGALVAAAAAGIDIGQAVSDLSAPLGFYRLSYLLPKALEFCNEVRSFGAELLAALEKKDAEALANLRARQETGLLQLVRRVREQQITEAETALTGLQRTRDMVQFRHDYFANLQRVNPREQEHLAAMDRAQALQGAAQVAELVSAMSAILPSIHAGASGFGGSPHFTVEWGGMNVGMAATAAARALSYFAGVETYQANRAALLGSWDRRSDEWKYQADMATKELRQIDQQIAAAQTRIQIANIELENHDRQIANAQEVETFLTDKFTSEDLYDFIVSEVSGLYFQAYQLAYQLAKQAERAYRFERGLTTSSIINFGAWDSLRRGLLAGERLALDVRRLEMTFMQQNAREYELTKNVSLLLHDPAAFVTLRETGRCTFKLPEALFDLDHPGHFMRRIKAVSLTIPCVAGPYTGVHGTLTLLSSRIRATDGSAGDYADETPGRFLSDFSAIQSIATSTGQNDTGLFELSFRDERYLPFEGAGAESTWRLDLPRATNAFDFDTITDVVLRIQYTAREGGDQLRGQALAAAQLTQTAHLAADTQLLLQEPVPQDLARAFSVRHEFPDAWSGFLNPSPADAGNGLSIDVTRDRFPARFRLHDLHITEWLVIFKWKDSVPAAAVGTGTLQVLVTPPGAAALDPVSFAHNAGVLAGAPVASVQIPDAPGSNVGTWSLVIPEASIQTLDATLRAVRDGHPRLAAANVQDIVLIANYHIPE